MEKPARGHHAPIALPVWCERGRGASSVLLVAPHGGRRPAVDPLNPPPRLRVNDVYTPEVTRILMDRLHAGAIINHGQDRNVLDLNRTSQVRRLAPWFLDLLVQELEHILSRHSLAEVVFVHGWNTGQPKCDIGIGAVESASGLDLPEGAGLTVSEAYLHERIGALRRACEKRGIPTAIGERYPGSHRNNLLQLFSARGVAAQDEYVRRIATWVTEGRIAALQLELGIPLRWPGSWRDRFVAAMVAALGGARRSNCVVSSPALATPPAPASEPVALQFYDPSTDVGVLAGVGPVGRQSIGGRLLLLLGGQRVALFTGEEVRASGAAVPPLRCDADGETIALEFAGPMLLLEDAATYLDLEAALAESQLRDVEVRLCFECSRGAQPAGPVFGAARGYISVANRRRDVAAHGFANAGALRAAGPGGQTMLAVDLGLGRGGILSRAPHEMSAQTLALRFTPEGVRALDGAHIGVTHDGDDYTPASFALRCNGQPLLRGQPLSKMAILRPAPRGNYLRVTFGAARFQYGDQTGYGLYEHARPLPARSALHSGEGAS